MKSPENGTAELKARHPLNCEARANYVLTIAAVACNGQISERYSTLCKNCNISYNIWYHSAGKFMWRCKTSMSISLSGEKRNIRGKLKKDRFLTSSWEWLPLTEIVLRHSGTFAVTSYPALISHSKLISKVSSRIRRHYLPRSHEVTCSPWSPLIVGARNRVPCWWPSLSYQSVKPHGQVRFKIQ